MVTTVALIPGGSGHVKPRGNSRITVSHTTYSLGRVKEFDEA